MTFSLAQGRHPTLYGVCLREFDLNLLDHKHIQGFVDGSGAFLTRQKARARAIETGQCPNPSHPTDLFSEELW
ncbi:MAG: hypothetical protein K2X11_00460 [Acetobacteraceae bacterium]|nr:hypothetical protein [Acetobacteraceae bacterium]